MAAGPMAPVVRDGLSTRHGAKVVSVDDGAAKKVKGYLRCLTIEDPSDTAPAFKAVKSVLEQTYTAATVPHFQLEPLNALAFEKDGVMEIHAGSQWQSLILPTLAKAPALMSRGAFRRPEWRRGPPWPRLDDADPFGDCVWFLRSGSATA